MSKAQEKLELFLYKNKLADKSFIDLLPKFSSNTIEYLLKDLSIIQKPKNENVIYIFSDGNCKSNGKNNAKAGYSVYFLNTSENYDPETRLYDRFNVTKQITSDNPTNNIAELSGIKHIFKVLSENIDLFKNISIVIVTDSQYSLNCITKWASGWIKNGWVNSKKEPVKNKELIQKILEYKNQIGYTLDIKFKHTFSHTKEPSNKESLEWVLWYGNQRVDDNINKLLS
jgi:ribonuclease HI